MISILLALGGFLIGVGVTVAVARYFFLLGWEKGRDDRTLDPGETVGQLPTPQPEASDGPLPVVGESSGRHARIDWPGSEDDTVVMRDAVHH
jgi:hypothetical protein